MNHTTPKPPSVLAVKAAEDLNRRGMFGAKPCDRELIQEIASIISRHFKPLVEIKEASEDAHDFIHALREATEGEGQIDKNSIMRCGETLKRTARKLDEQLRAALEKAGK